MSAERDREKVLVVGREKEAECDTVEVKMQEALEMQIVAEEECAGLLERFAVVSLLSFLILDIVVHFDIGDFRFCYLISGCILFVIAVGK